MSDPLTFKWTVQAPRCPRPLGCFRPGHRAVLGTESRGAGLKAVALPWVAGRPIGIITPALLLHVLALKKWVWAWAKTSWSAHHCDRFFFLSLFISNAFILKKYTVSGRQWFEELQRLAIAITIYVVRLIQSTFSDTICYVNSHFQSKWIKILLDYKKNKVFEKNLHNFIRGFSFSYFVI